MSIYSSSIIMSSKVLRSESTPFSLSLCSHLEFSSSKGTLTKLSHNSSVNWSMTAGKNDSDSLCSVQDVRYRRIDRLTGISSLYSIVYTRCFPAIYDNGWAIFWRNFVVIFYQPFGIKWFEGGTAKLYLNFLIFSQRKADSQSAGHTIPKIIVLDMIYSAC